ncbi:DNA (cytosine-5-)-methyltransferase [Antrihabitans cavernicola]|uniref:Cytosine-specific methyltransferase n=1 Tax=Antrihabitans cavernicola TaxID=2495913 RepID=A0A5A7S6Z4_9NOCA|nr:DNA (cytosine-5-)-methyltransferase [Spelaeibacter cavernicola]KAA0018086.1 DNA (cytosine-5-)-methyltransferase [Spelaeibacter cavernicola]
MAIPGSELRARRLSVGISQYRFARLAGVSSALLSSWELERSAPRAASARKVLTALAELETTYVPVTKRPSGYAGRRRRMPARPIVTVRSVDDPPVGAPGVLTAFSGCGGMAEGFRMAGCAIEGYLEVVPAARATFGRNFPQARCVGSDIRELDEDRVSSLLDGVQIDILAGGPPCQGFSLAGKRDPNDPRNQLFTGLLRLADLVRPSFVVMENVRLLLSMKDPGGGLVIDRIVGEMSQHGYDATVNVVNAQDYGVPQFRERVFIVATDARLGIAPVRFPAPTHGTATRRTFRDATADLAPLESGQASDGDPLHWAVEHPEHVLRWLRDVPEGMSAHDNDDPALRPPSGYNTTYKRLRWDEPASTIGTTFGMISASRNVHPTHTRSLTVREAVRIQTFPDDYVFDGKWGAIRTMIGNAVPPALAQVLAGHLVEILRSSTDRE